MSDRCLGSWLVWFSLSAYFFLRLAEFVRESGCRCWGSLRIGWSRIWVEGFFWWLYRWHIFRFWFLCRRFPLRGVVWFFRCWLSFGSLMSWWGFSVGFWEGKLRLGVWESLRFLHHAMLVSFGCVVFEDAAPTVSSFGRQKVTICHSLIYIIYHKTQNQPQHPKKTNN